MLDFWQDIWNEALSKLQHDESGQGLIEYALIGALVAVGLMVALTALRDSIGDVFTDITTELDNASVSQYGTEPTG